MENPFKKILQDEKLPDYLKDRVIDNINFIKLSLEVSELYTVKIPQAIESFIADPNRKREEEIIKKIKLKNKNNDNNT